MALYIVSLGVRYYFFQCWSFIGTSSYSQNIHDHFWIVHFAFVFRVSTPYKKKILKRMGLNISNDVLFDILYITTFRFKFINDQALSWKNIREGSKIKSFWARCKFCNIKTDGTLQTVAKQSSKGFALLTTENYTDWSYSYTSVFIKKIYISMELCWQIHHRKHNACVKLTAESKCVPKKKLRMTDCQLSHQTLSLPNSRVKALLSRYPVFLFL